MMQVGVRAVGGVAAAVGVGGSGRCGLSTGQTALYCLAFRKMLQKDTSKKGKKKGHTHEALPKLGDAETPIPRGGVAAGRSKMPKNSPRLHVLNKVYLDKISDILATGDLANQLYGRGLELSEVRFHPDLRGVNVYWVATGEAEKDREMGELLNSLSKDLRHQISNLRLLGHSPPITFVRDERHHKLQEVERLLAKADYGDDFVPVDPTHHLRTSIISTSSTPLHPSLKAAIQDYERQTATEEGEEEEEQPDPFEEALRIASTWPQQGVEAATTTTTTTTTTTAGDDDAAVTLPKDLPSMREDVLGVNTGRIYKMIQHNMSRAKAEHRRQPWVVGEEAGQDSSSSLDPSTQPHGFLTTNRKKDILQWARKYKKMQHKEKRSQNKEAAMMSATSAWQGYEDEGDEATEVHWVEEEQQGKEEFQ